MEIFGEVGAKLSPRLIEDVPSWQQLAPKMGHDSAKMTMLASVWELLKGSWEHFWSPISRSLEKWLKCKNDQYSITFGGFLGVGASSGGSWRLSWEGFGSYVGRCWLQDVVFWDILGDVVASWCQDGAQERQDEAR